MRRWPRPSLPRAMAGRPRHRHRLRRRDVEDHLLDVRQGSDDGLRWRHASQSGARPRSLPPSSASAWRRRAGAGSRSNGNRALAPSPTSVTPTSTPTSTAMRRAHRRHRHEAWLHERRIAGPRHRVPTQPVLPTPPSTYARAVGEAMRTEYQAIVDAGLDLQLDCPDLAMARHTGFQAPLRRRVPRTLRALHVDVLNEATRNIDPGRHAHAPVLG